MQCSILNYLLDWWDHKKTYAQKIIERFFFRYAPDGNTIGVVETPPPVPIRLQWDLENEELTKAIDTSFSVAQKLLNDVDLRILMYTKYGKGKFLLTDLKKEVLNPIVFL